MNPGSNLFVTGIHPKLSEEEVSHLFDKYGVVEKCNIMKDPHTRESRGFGFVKMMTSDEADAAKDGLQGEVYEGRTLSIEKARRARPRTPTPGKYFGPPKRGSLPPRSFDPSCPLFPCYLTGSVQAVLTETEDDRPPRGYRDRYDVSTMSKSRLAINLTFLRTVEVGMAGATTVAAEVATGTALTTVEAMGVVTTIVEVTATLLVLMIAMATVVEEATGATTGRHVVHQQSRLPVVTEPLATLHHRATTRIVAVTIEKEVQVGSLA